MMMLMLACATLTAWAQAPDKKFGLVAENFFAEKLYQSTGEILQAKPKAVFSHSISGNGAAVLHFFNMSPSGWVLVTAAENSVPVVAYSFKGCAVSEKAPPPGARMWLDEYSRQVRYNSDKAIPAGENIEELWKRYSDIHFSLPNQREKSRSVEPLLTSNWDQDKYYNEMCPYDPAGPGDRCYAGCVATAMGQIMNYFQWPDTGTGSYSYVWPPYGTISADFGNSSYQWHLMEPSISHSNPEIAEILHHLGVSVDMEYGPNGSGMTNHKAAFSMRTYFKYSPETEYVYRDSTTLNWDSLIISHLDRKIPMYYAGWSVPNINGHAFVVDGYQDSLYYHFNWGWSGIYNGYFYTSSLNPGGANFNLAQELIINAVPDTVQHTYPAYCQDTVVYTALGGTLEDGSGPLYDYQDNSACHWKIVPDDSTQGITLEFLRFETKNADVVTVYDGPDSQSPVLGTFSGDELPTPVTSSGNALFVAFETDNDSAAPGWQASYSCQLPDYCENMTVLNLPADTFSDGSGTYNYHNNTTCLWIIEPDDAESVTLNFLNFSTEDTMDVLKIYDMVTQELLATYSGAYSGTLPEPVTSGSGKMLVAFSTNYTVRDDGWEAYYMSNTVGLPESSGQAGITLSPNPATDQITLVMPEGTEKGKLYIFSIDGRLVLEAHPEKRETTVGLGHFKPGMYVYRLIMEEKVAAGKFMKK